MIIKNQNQIDILKEAGRRLAFVMVEVKKNVKSGIRTSELNKIAEDLIKQNGDTPSFLNYRPEGAKEPYPATLCVSVNDEVVHGIPGNYVLKEGDIVGFDMGLKHEGIFVDMAETVAVGNIDEQAKKLINITKESLMVGIKASVVGGHIGDIGNAIEEFVKPYKYGLVEVLGGHGVGNAVHEDPFIPNFGEKGEGAEIKEGMVLALEPMLNEGTHDVILEPDGYTFKTKDGKRSAHFEHTILITKNGPEVITKL